MTHAIIKFVYYGYNYDPKFIEMVWEDEPSMAQHLRSKFNNYYNDYGPRGVMCKFFVELSLDRQQQLSEWIEKNYDPRSRYVGWGIAKHYPHDASGIDNPEDFRWEFTNGLYYPITDGHFN